MPYQVHGLPDGLTQRPLAMPDARAVFEVMAAQEQHDIGSVEIEEADIVGDWQQPSFDIAENDVGVFDGDRMVAYAEAATNLRCDAAVHPEHRGRGIGTALARWTQDVGRSRGWKDVGMPVPEGSAGDRLMQALGYHVRWNVVGAAAAAGQGDRAAADPGRVTSSAPRSRRSTAP